MSPAWPQSPCPALLTPAAIVEFQYEEKAMAEQLSWLVRGAARLKAFMADTALWLEASWSSRQLPRGLLETFPQSVLQVGGW
jgi:hypothetical protein